MKKFIEEFKKFISRGNILDLAIGVVVGGAFGKITTSLVNDLLMPFIGWIFGSRDMTALNVVVREAVMDGDTVVKEAITLGFGNFVGAILDFLLIAVTVFAIMKAFNKANEAAHKKELEKKAAEEAAAAAAAAAEPAKPTTDELLTAILDEMKKK